MSNLQQPNTILTSHLDLRTWEMIYNRQKETVKPLKNDRLSKGLHETLRFLHIQVGEVWHCKVLCHLNAIPWHLSQNQIHPKQDVHERLFFSFLLFLNPPLGIQTDVLPHKGFFFTSIGGLLRSLIHFSLWHLISPALKKVCRKMNVFPSFRAAAMLRTINTEYAHLVPISIIILLCQTLILYNALKISPEHCIK